MTGLGVVLDQAQAADVLAELLVAIVLVAVLIVAEILRDGAKR
jgi:hypothetical protein